jgi:hypothetical protein
MPDEISGIGKTNKPGRRLQLVEGGQYIGRRTETADMQERLFCL